MMQIYKKHKCSVIAIEEIPKKDVSSYGIVKHNGLSDSVCKIVDLVEKPTVEKAPSNLAIIGRYILTPEIFDIL